MFPRITGCIAAVVATCGILLSAPAAAALQGLQLGMEAPAFSLKTAHGKIETLAGLKGNKLTIIVFWSSWSKKSGQILARMQQLHEKYRSRGISIIGVNSDGPDSTEMPARIAAFQEKLKITFPMLADPGLVAFRQYGVIALPTTVILDKEMTIVHELPGYPSVRSETTIQFVVSAAEGKEEPPLPQGKVKYRPNEKALRFFNMGVASRKSKRMNDTAETWFRKAAEADSMFILPHLNLAEIYLQSGNAAMASGEFKEVLARDPENVIALCEAGLMLVNEGKGLEALAQFEHARKVDESYTPAYYYAAYAYGKDGKMGDAMRMFDEAEKANPYDYRLFYFKGKVYEGNQDLKNAFSAYEKALAIILGST